MRTNERGSSFPKSVDLAGEEIQLRLMEAGDAANVHRFFLGQPPRDLIFLQRDVTDGGEIDAWVREIAAGEAVTILAEADGTLLGESTLHHSRVPWTRHVGTVRVITDSAQRGRGLGRLLLDEMFALGAGRGIEKFVAEMTIEQVPALRLFEQLGFREEGRYRSYVKDRQGVPHDLIVMTFDRPALGEAGVVSSETRRPWRCDACGHVTTAAEAPPRCPDCGASGEHLSEAEGTDR